MVERRKPVKTPGDALISGQPNDDFTLPATLWYGAVRLFTSAMIAAERKDRHKQEQDLLAALFLGFAFFEASLNQAAFGHAEAHRAALPQPEVDVLEEKETTIDEQGNIIRRARYYPLEARFSFVCQFLAGKEFDRSTPLWNKLKEARQLRDTWVHPKPPFDTWSLTPDQVREVLVTLHQVNVELSRMMGLDPPLWLVEFDELFERLRRGKE